MRVSKGFGFIEVNDGTFLKNLQIVFNDKLSNFSEVEKISIGSSIEVNGVLVKSPAAGQEYELQAENIRVINLAEADYPLQKKKHSFEFLREIAHLRSRSNTFSAVFRLRSVLSFAIHKFFQEEGFSYIHTPIISGSDAEGAGEMFDVTTLDLSKEIIKDNDGQVDYSKDFLVVELVWR